MKHYQESLAQAKIQELKSELSSLGTDHWSSGLATIYQQEYLTRLIAERDQLSISTPSMPSVTPSFLQLVTATKPLDALCTRRGFPVQTALEQLFSPELFDLFVKYQTLQMPVGAIALQPVWPCSQKRGPTCITTKACYIGRYTHNYVYSCRDDSPVFIFESDAMLHMMGFPPSHEALYVRTSSLGWFQWHEANDRSGSGLDADLLDGKAFYSGTQWHPNDLKRLTGNQ